MSSSENEPVRLKRHVLPADAGEIELVYVPAGEFPMGADEGFGSGDERPRHLHPIPSGFWIARTQTTWLHYLRFCEAADRPKPFARAGRETITRSRTFTGRTRTRSVVGRAGSRCRPRRSGRRPRAAWTDGPTRGVTRALVPIAA